jgi:hypothetical protein
MAPKTFCSKRFEFQAQRLSAIAEPCTSIHTLCTECSRAAVNLRYPHDEAVVRVAVHDLSWFGLNVFSRQNDHAHQTVAMITRPLEIRQQFGFSAARFSSQLRSVSWLINDSISVPLNLILPHCDDDDLPILSDCGLAETTAGAYRAKVSEAACEGLNLHHLITTLLVPVYIMVSGN